MRLLLYLLGFLIILYAFISLYISQSNFKTKTLSKEELLIEMQAQRQLAMYYNASRQL